jgi:hypothetical protein
MDSVQISPATTGSVGPGEESQQASEEHFYGKPQQAPAGPASSIASTGADPAGTFQRVDIAAEGGAEPGDLTTDVPDDSLILGKFKTQADLEQAYTALSAKLGAPAEAPEAIEADAGGKIPEAPVPAQGTEGLLSDEALGRYTTEFIEKGALSTDSFKELAAAGIPQGLAESHLAGLKALQENRVGAIHKAAGGAEEYGQLVAWAQENMNAKQISSYNRAIESGDQEQAVLAAEGLRARAFGTTPAGRKPSRRIVGKPSVVSGVQPYSSQNEMVEAVQDPKYKTSPAFREQHAQRLRVSQM